MSGRTCSNEKLVNTVGDMLVDLTHSNHFLVRDIADCDDVVCTPVVVSRGRPETLLSRSSLHTGILLVDFIGDGFTSTLVEVDMAVIVLTMFGLSHAHTHTAAACSSGTGLRHVGLDTVALAVADCLTSRITQLVIDTLSALVNVGSLLDVSRQQCDIRLDLLDHALQFSRRH